MCGHTIFRPRKWVFWVLDIKHWVCLFLLSEDWNTDVEVTQLWQFSSDSSLENGRTTDGKNLNRWMTLWNIAGYLPALNQLLPLNITWERNRLLSCLNHYILRSLSLYPNTFSSKLSYNIWMPLNNDMMMQLKNCFVLTHSPSHSQEATPLAKGAISFTCFHTFWMLRTLQAYSI